MVVRESEPLRVSSFSSWTKLKKGVVPISASTLVARVQALDSPVISQSSSTTRAHLKHIRGKASTIVRDVLRTALSAVCPEDVKVDSDEYRPSRQEPLQLLRAKGGGYGKSTGSCLR